MTKFQRVPQSSPDSTASPAAIKAAETIVALLDGFEIEQGLSALANATAIILANLYVTETNSIEASKQFRKNIEAALRLNFENGAFGPGSPVQGGSL